MTPYQEQIVNYYKATETSYRDGWGLEKNLAIHYGYWDDKVSSFAESLHRMNEVMAETVSITGQDRILDAGCGVGGSSIYLAQTFGCRAVGITLSQRQVDQAFINAKTRGVSDKTEFKVMDYCKTDFPDASFDVVWGCESICYAENKEQFIYEAYRLLKPGGRLVIADGMIPKFEYNEHPINRRGIEGWAANYIETPENFQKFMRQAGFKDIQFRDITKNIMHSSRRMLYFYFAARLYHGVRRLIGRKPPGINQGHIQALLYQYVGFKKKLWLYGLLSGKKLVE